MKKITLVKGDQVMIRYENFNPDGSIRRTNVPAIYDRKEGKSHIAITPSGIECYCGPELEKAKPINAILTSKGTVCLGENQWIQETDKSLEIWENVPDEMRRLIARYNKINRWVSYNGGETMTML